MPSAPPSARPGRDPHPTQSAQPGAPGRAIYRPALPEPGPL